MSAFGFCVVFVGRPLLDAVHDVFQDIDLGVACADSLLGQGAELLLCQLVELVAVLEGVLQLCNPTER